MIEYALSSTSEQCIHTQVGRRKEGKLSVALVVALSEEEEDCH
jgi:hypothetical protein